MASSSSYTWTARPKKKTTITMAIRAPQPPSLLFLCLALFVHSTKTANDNNSNEIKGMFVFGSSLVDNGNNNFLKGSRAKADYLPYGIDFPYGVSGRFTNGKNVIDLLGEQLKLPSFIPPFTHPSTAGYEIVHGVNFASGASGILDDTGSIAGRVISLNQQIRNFEKTLPELEALLGRKRREILSKYLFVVGSGGNDYTLNYFLTKVYTSLTLQSFTANLTDSLSQQLKKLYKLGGRKFVIMSIYPIGCSPVVMTYWPKRTRCVHGLNCAARLFNFNLKALVDVLKPQMPGSVLLVVNCYKIIRDILKNPILRGFKETRHPCCKVKTGIEGGDGASCKRGGKVCSDRNSHVYFDGLHPTQAVNVHIASKAFASHLPTEVYPFNISQLANL